MSKKNRDRKYGSAEVKGGSDLVKFYWAIGVVALLGLGIVGWSVGSKAMSPTVSEPIPLTGMDDQQLVALGKGITKGDPNAPITIAEFGDFQCPACGSFFSTVEPQLEAEFINTGKAKFVFYNFPLVEAHQHAFLAARAGLCADDQGKFWPYHDMLYRMQGDWSAIQNPAGNFEGYAKDLSLDADAFSSCLRSDKHADAISASIALGMKLQLPGTPSIMVSAGRGLPRRVVASLEGIREGVAVIEQELSGTSPKTGG